VFRWRGLARPYPNYLVIYSLRTKSWLHALVTIPADLIATHTANPCFRYSSTLPRFHQATKLRLGFPKPGRFVSEIVNGETGVIRQFAGLTRALYAEVYTGNYTGPATGCKLLSLLQPGNSLKGQG